MKIVNEIQYIKSKQDRFQGTYDEALKYAHKNGYRMSENNHGNFLFTSPAKVIVSFDNSQPDTNMKNEILDYYGKKRVTEKLSNEFKTDVRNGKVAIDDNNKIVKGE